MYSQMELIRTDIINKLQQRNNKESEPFRDIIQQNNNLQDCVSQLRADNLRLQVESEQLRSDVMKGTSESTLSILEKKLLSQQEELTELHKRKGEHAQMIVDLNIKCDKQKKILCEQEKRIEELQSLIATLRAEGQMLRTSKQELDNLNRTLLDEHVALQMMFNTLEEKLRTARDENLSLLDRLMQYKTKDADKMNEENESFLRKRSDRIRRNMEEVTRELSSPRQSTSSLQYAGIDPAQSDQLDIDVMEALTNELRCCAGEDKLTAALDGTKAAGCAGQQCPTKILVKFDAHENEAHAVRWSPVSQMIATGGADRKVKLWDVTMTTKEPHGVLSSSSAAINSVEFDAAGNCILASSNDCSARVWTVSDSRLKQSLTGHCGKVMAAKYVQENLKVVTGSHDRTLKIWDLRTVACVETKFAGSSCNDLVTTDSLGSTIISGHYDKKIRFWDIRTEKQSDDLIMQAKVTSLDLSKDCNYLICSVRDDTIKLLDLRKNQVISTFSHEHFKLSCDWARASLNATGTKIACGSVDGLIYIWNVNGFLEATIEGHNTPVNAVSWNASGNFLATVGKSKKCIIYTDT